MTASMRSLGSTTAVAVGTLNFAAAASGSLVRLLTSDRTNSEGYCGSLARLGSNASKGNIPSRLVWTASKGYIPSRLGWTASKGYIPSRLGFTASKGYIPNMGFGFVGGTGTNCCSLVEFKFGEGGALGESARRSFNEELSSVLGPSRVQAIGRFACSYRSVWVGSQQRLHLGITLISALELQHRIGC